MATSQQLNFLQERIEEIGSAIFYNLSDAVLKLPTSVVNSVKVDDYGFVWICLQKQTQRLQEFEQEFPVRLDFYRKGAGYFLQIAGRGFVVTDPEEVNGCGTLPEEVKNLSGDKVALVKVKIQKAEYYETKTSQNATWWQSAVSYVVTWFRNNQYRSDSIYFPAS